ncbi:hypothetical protein [Celeribacter marinus]|uniref:hypothetical protein n=1 Tax=Celeribacter marinus TaxID=1397108 RepID=UPI0031730A14
MKVLVLGTSHTVCFREALTELRTDYSDLTLQTFGLPGGKFADASFEGTTFCATPHARDVALEWNGVTQIDLAPFDHILMVGERFSFQSITRMLASHDILEDAPRAADALISTAALEALIDGAVAAQVSAIVARFGRDARITCLPAPYPLARSWKQGAGHERFITTLSNRDTAHRWMTRFEASIGAHLAEAGMGFLAQPRNTLHDAFRSRNAYAWPNSSQEAAGAHVDNRHLNTEYARIAFAAYANDTLNMRPTRAHTT